MTDFPRFFAPSLKGEIEENWTPFRVWGETNFPATHEKHFCRVLNFISYDLIPLFMPYKGLPLSIESYLKLFPCQFHFIKFTVEFIS